MLFATPTAVIPHVRSGKLKAIAISGPGRFSGLPQVPTFAEAGLPAFELKTWYGMLAPAATPKAIVEKLSGDIARILARPDLIEAFLSQGLDPFTSTPEQFAAVMKADTGKFEKIIRTADLKPDQ